MESMTNIKVSVRLLQSGFGIRFICPACNEIQFTYTISAGNNFT